VRNLHDRNGTLAGDARNAEHRSEHVQPPRHPANVQLALGEADHRRQTAAPSVIGQIVAYHMLGTEGRRHPLRVSQGGSIVDPHCEVRAGAGTTADLLDSTLQFRRFGVECVELKVIVGDFGRHPVELRIDGRHPVRRHGLSRASR
jgi:hypothetical protein